MNPVAAPPTAVAISSFSRSPLKGWGPLGGLPAGGGVGAGLGAFGFAAGVTAFLKAAMGSGMEAFATAGTGAALAGAVAFAGAAATTLRAGAATRGLFVAPSAAATIGFFSSVMLSLGLAIPATDGYMELSERHDV